MQGGALGGGGEGDSGDGVEGTLAKSTGSHCVGHATGWLTSASLLATLGFAVRGRIATQKAAATPTRTSARKLEASCFA